MTLHEFLTRREVSYEGFAINIFFNNHIMKFKFKDIDAADIRFGEYDVADFYINFELKIISIWMR